MRAHFSGSPVVQNSLDVLVSDRDSLLVGLAAGLTVRTEGYLGIRGMRPPAPYLHNGALL